MMLAKINLHCILKDNSDHDRLIPKLTNYYEKIFSDLAFGLKLASKNVVILFWGISSKLVENIRLLPQNIWM